MNIEEIGNPTFCITTKLQCLYAGEQATLPFIQQGRKQDDGRLYLIGYLLGTGSPQQSVGRSRGADGTVFPKAITPSTGPYDGLTLTSANLFLREP